MISHFYLFQYFTLIKNHISIAFPSAIILLTYLYCAYIVEFIGITDFYSTFVTGMSALNLYISGFAIIVQNTY